MPRVLLSVINDVHTDNRIHRTATVFQERGYDVSVVGRQWPNPAPVERPYAVHRFVCRRNKGALFYLEYQIRLLRYLLRESFDVYVANDLDTLLPMSLAAFLRKKPLFYDSHEYFCGVPELARRPAVRAVWLAVERFCMPLVTEAVTVSPPIARAYFQQYGIPFTVVRNVPLHRPDVGPSQPNLAKDWNFGKPDAPVILLQGAGINVDRGAEEAVLAMRELPDAQLWIVGSGDVLPQLHALVAAHGLEDRVFFHGRVPASELREFTRRARVGLSLDKPTNPNYRWSLPNKLFDAFHAGLPQVVSPVEEVARTVQSYGAGWVLDSVTPEDLAQVLRNVLWDDEACAEARDGALRAAERYHWGRESQGWHRCIDRMEGRAPNVHLISMDAPVPPLYGGMAEVSSQIDALETASFAVEVHAFISKKRIPEVAEIWNQIRGQRQPASEKSHFQEDATNDTSGGPSVRLWLYPRKRWASFFQRLPYLVASRASVPLVRRLECAPVPVVVHGYHSLWSVLVSRSVAARSFLRLHNPERLYYRGLAATERGADVRSWLKRRYYFWEANRLARFEQKVLPRLKLAGIWALTPGDAAATAPFFRTAVEVIPPAVPALAAGHLSSAELFPLPELPFLLVHGKLSVPENDWAAHRWLDVWAWDQVHGGQLSESALVVAGQGASGALRQRAAALPGVWFVDTPSPEGMAHLLRAAALHGQLAVHRAGIKYKMLHALQTQVPLLGNEDLVVGTGAEGLVRLLPEPYDPQSWIAAWKESTVQPLSTDERQRRAQFVAQHSLSTLAHALESRLLLAYRTQGTVAKRA
jgi:glycosyltransferase involved in cell wall biosynthesis